VEDLVKRGAIEDKIIPLDKALSNLPQIKVTENLAKRIKCGNPILFRDLREVSTSGFRAGEKIKISSLKDKLIAVAEPLVSYSSTDDKNGGDTACRLIRVFSA
jgi:tRNA U55 pseudouridine synthase TruB